MIIDIEVDNSLLKITLDIDEVFIKHNHNILSCDKDLYEEVKRIIESSQENNIPIKIRINGEDTSTENLINLLKERCINNQGGSQV